MITIQYNFRDVTERNDWVEAINSAIEEYRGKKASFVSPQESHPGATVQGAGDILGDSAPVWIRDQRVTMCQVQIHDNKPWKNLKIFQNPKYFSDFFWALTLYSLINRSDKKNRPENPDAYNYVKSLTISTI